MKNNQEFKFSLETLNKIFKILFFADQDSGTLHGAQMLDNSQRSIGIVSKVLNRISGMPLQMPDRTNLPQSIQGNPGSDNQQVNLLKLYQTADNAENVELNFMERLDGEPNGQTTGTLEDGKSKKSGLNIVTQKTSQILNMCMQSFYNFFMSKFDKLDENADQKRSILSTTSKSERRELTHLIEKILHVFKISVNLAPSKGGDDQKDDNPEGTGASFMLSEDGQLNKLLQIVQMVIDNEEACENQLQSLGENKEETGRGGQAYLYKEEFKLILQLVFTLSHYDLKNSKIMAPGDSDLPQQDVAAQARQQDRP